jgi:hypothetical protein
MTQVVTDSPISNLPLPTRPLPLAQPIGTGWIPAIYHAERSTEYTRFERFQRKAKLTADEALRYAAHTIHFRQIRKADKRRKIEAISDPRWLAIAAE